MATPLTPLYRQYHQRTLITGLTAAIVLVIVLKFAPNGVWPMFER